MATQADNSGSGNTTDKAFLAEQGWKYDAFLCYKSAPKSKAFVQLLDKELRDRDVVSFFDKTAFVGGEDVQYKIAQAIGLSPFFVVILSHEMKGSEYPEAEIEAALAFREEEKKTIPIFYGMTTDDCNKSKSPLYKQLSGVSGFVTQEKDDARIAADAADFIKNAVQRQRDSRELKLVKLPHYSPKDGTNSDPLQWLKEVKSQGGTDEPDSGQSSHESIVTPQQMLKIAKATASDSWRDIGILLGFSDGELDGFEYGKKKQHLMLNSVFAAWKNREKHPTVGKLLAVCEEAGLGQAARSSLGEG